MLKKTAFKVIATFVVMTIVVNLILSLLSTWFPIEFLKPSEIIEAPRVFYSLKLGRYSLELNQTLLNTWVIMALIILILILGTRKLSITNPGTMQLILEEYYNFIQNVFLANFRQYKKKFMPFFAALFSLILFSNLSVFLFPFVFVIERINGKINVMPFFRTSTADINTTIGFALVVTVIFVTCWVKREGIFGIFKELCRPHFLMLPINLIGEFAKPINISMRLFGNMFAGLVIMELLYGISFNNILPNWTFNTLKGSVSFAVGWPIVLQLYLDLFIGILQAYVFTILSSVYIEQTLIGDSEEE